jgi:hypothetical protein
LQTPQGCSDAKCDVRFATGVARIGISGAAVRRTDARVRGRNCSGRLQVAMTSRAGIAAAPTLACRRFPRFTVRHPVVPIRPQITPRTKNRAIFGRAFD